jgi:hypothetical protein
MPVSLTENELLYDTLAILEGTANVPTAPTFLKQSLFAIDETTPADAVLIDSYRGSNRLAPFVAKRKRGIKVLREPFQTSSYKPPRIAPVKDLHADDLMLRTPGEAAYSRKSGSEREAYWLTLDWADLDNRIARRIEWMIAQLLFTGTITATDADDKKVIDEINYGTPETVTPAALWSAAGSDPHADLKAAMRHLTSVCYAQADLVILGKSAADAYVKNQAVIDGFNKLWVRPGEMRPEEKSLGVFQISTWMGLPLYSYELTYTDDDGTERPFIPDDRVLIAASAIRHKVAYAGVAQVEPGSKRMDVFEGVRVPQVFYSEEDDCRYFRLTSRPIPVPGDMLGWCVMDVV